MLQSTITSTFKNVTPDVNTIQNFLQSANLHKQY